MPNTLEEAYPAIQQFVGEARKCADQELGFAALCVLFPVILSLGEALSHEVSSSETVDETGQAAIKQFLHYLSDHTWYVRLRKPKETFSSEDLTGRLAAIRHALAHQFSLPNHICLIPGLKGRGAISKLGNAVHEGLAVQEFVTAVSIAVKKIMQEKPDLVIDKTPRRQPFPRSPANRRQVQIRGYSIGASAPGVGSVDQTQPDDPA